MGGLRSSASGAWRRLCAAILIAGGMAVAVAACGSSSGSGGGSASAGASTGSSGGSCPTMKIAVLGPFTGSSAVYMPATWNSAELVVNAHNKAYPNCKVSLVKMDTQGDPSQDPGLVRQAISNPDIVAVQGPFFSGEVQAVEPLLNDAGMPTVISDATIPSLAQNGWKVFHRVVVNDAVEGAAEGAYIINTLKAKRVAVIDNGESYGKGNATIVAAAVKKAGATIVDRESIDPTANDYSSTVNRLKAADPQVVYCGCLYAEAARLVQQMRQAGVTSKFMGDAGLYDPHLVKLAGSAANGTIIGSGGTDPAHTPGGKAYLAKWKAAYGGTPQLYGAENYDATTAIIKAIEAGNHTRSSINTYLSTKTNFEGATGHVSFGSNGDIQHKTVNFYVVKNGKITYTSTVN